jgi:GT2 family glycosyltransferase
MRPRDVLNLYARSRVAGLEPAASQPQLGMPVYEAPAPPIEPKLVATLPTEEHASGARPVVRGKFIHVGDEKFYVRGVTYGTFRPDRDGLLYPEQSVVESDFRQMAASGINALRTYTVPPLRLLDRALQHGLQVLVGIPWEQHVTFLDEKALARKIRRRVARSVAATRGHPAVLGYAVGNEIPAPIVRWHGASQIERFIGELHDAAKDADPEALVTYVNYPTTEYLELPFLDFVAFNVFLESEEPLRAYLARLHNLAGDRPLLMTEIGLDSRSHGELGQAAALDWQIRSTFSAGCAGAFIFSWTDEWHRGGCDIEDWDFGLTARDRTPKPALAAVQAAPRVSVVVCTYNGARTIDETLGHVARLNYPDYEVIVVNDGSTDATRRIVGEHRERGVRLISTSNRGLASARNAGLAAATGEIVAYIDDDAYPDPDWLMYVATAFRDAEYAGYGGPNIVPEDDGLVAQGVAHAPGGPTHVLLCDREAEHIPGCNMAFRRSALEAIGGFDTKYRAAGDDVDVCWQLQEHGWKLGYHPGALVWHHRRGSVRGYWKQQVGYGKAEALLEEKWPAKYNAAGHVEWTGRIYGSGLTRALRIRPGRVYQGTWGSAPFQRLYHSQPGTWMSLPLMPEWYLVIAGLVGLSVIGLGWRPLLLAVPLLILVVSATITQAAVSASAASCRSLVFLLHLVQPAARLYGRVKHGLTPWRSWNLRGWSLPLPRSRAIWSEEWSDPSSWLASLEASLREQGVPVVIGGDFDHWDVEVRGGLFGAARAVLVAEEHGTGRQYFRFRVWPKLRRATVLMTLPALLLYLAAMVRGTPAAAAALGFGALFMSYLTLRECGSAVASMMEALRRVEAEEAA